MGMLSAEEESERAKAEAIREEHRVVVRGKLVEAARADLDAAGQRMERLANGVIERLIRKGYATRSDVERLRSGDAECRRLADVVAELEAGKGYDTSKTQEAL